MTIHLTHTGLLAGQTFCGVRRDNDAALTGDVQYAHGVYAPLERADYRAQCCVACMREFASSWDHDEDKPNWVQLLLREREPETDPRQQVLFA